ncbi:MAG: MoaD/ThiS family protein [Candidatus Lokiarchaeota archaeon]
MSQSEISVLVKFFASLRQYGPRKEKIKLKAGSKIKNILEKYSIPSQENLVIIVNGHPHKTENYFLNEGDIVAIFPTIAGG